MMYLKPDLRRSSTARTYVIDYATQIRNAASDSFSKCTPLESFKSCGHESAWVTPSLGPGAPRRVPRRGCGRILSGY